MSLFAPLYSPSDFAAAVGVSPDTLRDWRRRGMPVGVLPAHGGRHTYCDYDLLEAAVVGHFLHVGHIDGLRDAMEAARFTLPRIARLARLPVFDDPLRPVWLTWEAASGRFVVISAKHAREATDDPKAVIEKGGFAGIEDTFRVIDCERAFANLRGQIETILKRAVGG